MGALHFVDLTGDGVEELVSIPQTVGGGSGSGPLALEVFRLDGEGTPVELLSSLTSNWTGPAAFYDVNGDGQLDVIAATWSSRVAVLHGDGQGGLDEVQRILGGTVIHSVSVQDVDGDGLVDIGFGCRESFENQVAYGLPQGGFADGESISTGFLKPEETFYRDITGDGLLDVVFRGAQSASTPKRLAYAINQGGRQFGAFIQPSPIVPIGDIRMADLDGDGLDDVIAGAGGGFAVFLQQARGAPFAAPVVLPQPSSSAILEIDDFDGDGLQDLFVHRNNGEQYETVVLLNQGGLAFSSQRLALTPTPLYGTVSGPLPSGGRIMTHVVLGQLSLVPLLSSVYDARFASTEIGTPPAVTFQSGDPDLELADFTGDGIVDGMAAIVFFTGSSYSGSLRLMTGSEDGTLSPGVEIVAGRIPIFEAGDLDGDGDLDVVVYIEGSLLGLRVYLNGGDGQFFFGGEVPISAAPREMTLGDFTNDGLMDIALTLESDELQVIPGLGGGFLGSAVVIDSGRSFEDIAWGDFDSDGWGDLAVVVEGADELLAYFGDPALGRPGAPSLVGTAEREVVTVDIDGDGVQDLAVVNRDEVIVFLSMPDRGFVSHRVALGTDARDEADLKSGDIDGDGYGDLLLGGRLFGMMMIRGTGYGAAEVASYWRSFNYGAFSDYALGDLNGDGLLDVAFTTKSTSKFFTVLHLGQ